MLLYEEKNSLIFILISIFPFTIREPLNKFLALYYLFFFSFKQSQIPDYFNILSEIFSILINKIR